MSRTVLVTTKLDTKLPQFGASEDLEDFLMYAPTQSVSAAAAAITVVFVQFCVVVTGHRSFEF